MPNPGDNKSVPAGAVPAKPAEIRTFANFLETRGPDSEQYVSGLGDPGGRECAENPGPDGRPCACCIRYSRKPGCARHVSGSAAETIKASAAFAIVNDFAERPGFQEIRGFECRGRRLPGGPHSPHNH